MNKNSDYFCIGWIKWWLKKSKLKGDRYATVFELNVGRVFDSYVHEKKRYLVFLGGNGIFQVSILEDKTYFNLFDLACGEKMPKHIYSQFYAQFAQYFIPTVDDMFQTNIARSRIVVDSRLNDHTVTALDAFDEIPEYNRYAF